MIRNHKHNEEVKEILNKSEEEQKNKFFDTKRHEGIYSYNLSLMGEGKEPAMRARQPKNVDNLRCCSECKMFISSRAFSRHDCNAQYPQPIKPGLLQKADTKISKDIDFQSILNRFRDGEIGDICRQNCTIQMIGYRHFNLRRHEVGKQDEVRKVVMAEMQELSRLFNIFKSLSGERSGEDMFTRKHLPELEEAIQMLVTNEEDKTQKHGQKLFIDAIILRLTLYNARRGEEAVRLTLKRRLWMGHGYRRN